MVRRLPVLVFLLLFLAGCFTHNITSGTHPPRLVLVAIDGVPKSTSDAILKIIQQKLKIAGIKAIFDDREEAAALVVASAITANVEAIRPPWIAIIDWLVATSDGTLVASFRQRIQGTHKQWTYGNSKMITALAASAVQQIMAIPWTPEKQNITEGFDDLPLVDVVWDTMSKPYTNDIQNKKHMVSQTQVEPLWKKPLQLYKLSNAKLNKTKSVFASLPSAKANSQPLLHVIGVRNAPGDGNTALTHGMILALKKRGMQMTNAPSEADLIVDGWVEIEPRVIQNPWVKLFWRLSETSNTELGIVAQHNQVTAEILNDRWGRIALQAADGGATGLMELLKTWEKNQQMEQQMGKEAK